MLNFTIEHLNFILEKNIYIVALLSNKKEQWKTYTWWLILSVSFTVEVLFGGLKIVKSLKLDIKYVCNSYKLLT